VRRSQAIGLATGLALLPRLSRAEEPISAEQRAELTQLLSEAAHAPETIGFSVAVSYNGVDAFEAARGKRTLDPDAPSTVDTWYCIGSVTKQFTAALIMQLVEANRLALDAKLATVLADFPHAAEITFRQLLTHTSGLAEYTARTRAAALMARTGVPPAELVALIAGQPLDFTPGAQWEYSNSNYLALGLTIERLSGKPYAQVLRERIVQPLGLAVNPGPPTSGEIARGYGSEPTPTPMPPSDISWAYAAGEIYATTGGLLAWNKALFGGRVVSAASLAQMTTPMKLASGTSSDYGFGLFVLTVRGHRIISHNGGVPGGFAAQNFVFPDDGLAIATLANTLYFNVALPAPKIADVFLPGVSDLLDLISRQHVAELDDPEIRRRAREWIGRLKSGSWETSQLTPEMVAVMTPEAVKPGRTIIETAGTVKDLHLAGFALRGGYRIYVYNVTGTTGTFVFTFVLDHRDKIAGLFVKP